MKKRTKPATRRFSVTLEAEEYDRLRELATEHHPRLTLQYTVRYAVHLLLKKAEDPKFSPHFGDPLPENGSDGQG